MIRAAGRFLARLEDYSWHVMVRPRRCPPFTQDPARVRRPVILARCRGVTTRRRFFSVTYRPVRYFPVWPQLRIRRGSTLEDARRWAKGDVTPQREHDGDAGGTRTRD